MNGPPAPVVGTTAQMPALELLRALARARSSGMLKIGSTAPAWAALADGELVVAGLTTGPGIGDALRTAGLIDGSATLDGASRGGAHDLALLERLAEEAGAEALRGIVRDHAIGAVFQMLLPATEEYSFQPGPSVALARHLSFPMEEIICAAQDRVRAWAEIAESVPSTQAVFRMRRALPLDVPNITVGRDDWAILAVLDGRRSVAQTIAATGREPFDVCSTLPRLYQGGVVERL
jgi:hypothetical protein